MLGESASCGGGVLGFSRAIAQKSRALESDWTTSGVKSTDEDIWE